MLRAPKDPNYLDSLSKREVYYLYPLERRIYVEKQRGKWYYSAETISELDELYSEIYILEINAKKYFPASYWYKKVFGITIIKWLGLLLLIPICFFAYFLSKSVYYLFVNRHFKRKFKISETVSEEIRKSSKLLGLFITTKLFNKLLPELQLPVSWNAFLLRSVGIISIILLIAIINKIIEAFTIYFTGKASNSKSRQALIALNRVLKAIIWTIGIIYMLQFLGVNVVALLTGLSIGGLIIALAAQDTVKNLIGSVMIFIDNPFKLGDWVKFNNVEGEIEQIGFRSTRIRTFEDSLVYVPNSILADNVVNNLGMRNYRCFKTHLQVKQPVSLLKLNTFIKELRVLINEHPYTVKKKYGVSLYDIDKGLPSIIFYCFFTVHSYEDELKARHELLKKIINLSEKEGIAFALPSNLIYINNENEHAILKNNKV